VSEHSDLPLTQSQSEATTISTITSTITQTVAPSTTTVVTSTQFQTVSPTETVTAYALPKSAPFRIQAIGPGVTGQFIGAPSRDLAYMFGSSGNSFSFDNANDRTGGASFLYDNTLRAMAISKLPNDGELSASSAGGYLTPASVSTSNDAGPAQRCRFRAVDQASGLEYNRACGGTWYLEASTSCSPLDSIELYVVSG
jgi:hypothetical protein